MTTNFITLKNILLLALVSALISVVVTPVSALGFFSDTEEAREQTFVASELLFDTELDNQEVYVGPGLMTEALFTLPVLFSSATIKNKYSFRVTQSTGDAAFCEALALETAFGGNSSVGAFETFESAAYETPGDIDMTVHYDDTKRTIEHNSRCTAEIEVTAWQHNMSLETAGYRDTKTFTVTAIAHMVVLNEVLPRPNTTDTQVPNVEFIELFNNSDFDVDVLGWNITELTAAGLPTNHIISNLAAAPASALVAYNNSYSTVVPARGHLALRYRGSSSYLNDAGDRITLIGNDGVAIDSYAFGVALVGKSDARIPDGVGAWVDPIPTPNEINIAEAEFILVATSSEMSLPLPTVFMEIEQAEAVNTTTETVASSTDVVVPETEEVAPAPVVDEPIVATTTEELVVVEETVVVDEVAVTEVETEPKQTEPDLPLSDTKEAKEVIQPEPVAKTTEEEIEPEEVLVTATE